MSDGPWTHKRLSTHSVDKFTRPGNIAYAQQFLNFLHNVPAKNVKFFDEAGVNVGDGNPTYGHSLMGTLAIEIIPGNTKGANYTLNLLCGLDGVFYANTVQGAANTIDFLNFWGEAIGYTALQVEHLFLITGTCLCTITHRLIVMMAEKHLLPGLWIWGWLLCIPLFDHPNLMRQN